MAESACDFVNADGHMQFGEAPVVRVDPSLGGGNCVRASRTYNYRYIPRKLKTTRDDGVKRRGEDAPIGSADRLMATKAT
jgi:hypothetical protein